MSHVQKTKKRSNLVRNLVILAFIGVVLVVAVSSWNQSNPVPTSTRTTGNSLSADRFYVAPTVYLCGAYPNGTKFISVRTDLHNDENATFHFLFAKIVFVNYTLADGNVVTENLQITDNTQTFATMHRFSFLVPLKTLQSGPKVTSVTFTITANVEGVTQPIYISWTDSMTKMLEGTC